MTSMHPGRIVLGGSLVALGVLYLLATLDAIESVRAIAGKWWPLAVIAYGVLQLIADRTTAVGSGGIIALGAFLLGRSLGIFDASIWRFVWPFVLIGAGIWVLAGRAERTVGGGRSINTGTLLGLRKVRVQPGPLEDGSIVVVLGSLTLDLSEVEPPGDIDLRATVIAGSLSVMVPEGWEIDLDGTPILGMWDNTTARNGEGKQLLRIRALTVAGAIEVRHRARWG